MAKDVTSVLIVRPGALGDAVITFPLLEALLAAGASRLTLLGSPASWGFLAPEQSLIDIRDIGGRDWLGLFGEGTRLGPSARSVLAGTDAVVVLLGPRRDAVERTLAKAGIACVAGASPAPGGKLACDSPTPRDAEPYRAPWPPGEAHAAARLFAALETLKFPGGPARWPQLPRLADALLRPASDEADLAMRSLGLAAVPPQGLLILHPGSGSLDKRWPVDRFTALAVAAARSWGVRPVFLLGPAEEDLSPALAAALPAGLEASVVRSPPLRQAFVLLSLARAYVGNDSGITHLAARVAPTLALFGPSNPRVWHPLGARAVVLRAPEGRLESLTVQRALAALALVL